MFLRIKYLWWNIYVNKLFKKELDLCARIMRAEALAEGDLGMLMVGNVVVNRAIANCLDFKDTRTITDVIYQKINLVELNQVFFKVLVQQEKKI